MLEYIVTNFPLFCVCLAMGITAITTFRSNKKASTDVLVILGLCISLSVTVYFDIYASKQVETYVLATWMTYLGYVLRIESGMLLLPVIVGLIYGEGQWLYYLISAAICAVFGFALSIVKPVNKVFYLLSTIQ